jgi:hypothetical protein
MPWTHQLKLGIVKPLRLDSATIAHRRSDPAENLASADRAALMRTARLVGVKRVAHSEDPDFRVVDYDERGRAGGHNVLLSAHPALGHRGKSG